MNELIGLQYQWGANPDEQLGFTDCFQLFCAIRRRLGMKDYTQQFAWAYQQYDQDNFPWRIMKQWLHENCLPTMEDNNGNVGMFKKRPALATIANGRVYCIAPRGRSVSMMINKDIMMSIHWFSPQ